MGFHLLSISRTQSIWLFLESRGCKIPISIVVFAYRFQVHQLIFQSNRPAHIRLQTMLCNRLANIEGSADHALTHNHQK